MTKSTWFLKIPTVVAQGSTVGEAGQEVAANVELVPYRQMTPEDFTLQVKLNEPDGVVVTSAGTRAYVVNQMESKLEVVDLPSRTVIGEVYTGIP